MLDVENSRLSLIKRYSQLCSLNNSFFLDNPNEEFKEDPLFEFDAPQYYDFSEQENKENKQDK